MKRILIFLMTLVTLAVTTPAFAAKRSIMELPPYERAVLIIKYHETLHPESIGHTSDTVTENSPEKNTFVAIR